MQISIKRRASSCGERIQRSSGVFGMPKVALVRYSLLSSSDLARCASPVHSIGDVDGHTRFASKCRFSRSLVLHVLDILSPVVILTQSARFSTGSSICRETEESPYYS